VECTIEEKNSFTEAFANGVEWIEKAE
jgi:hypothetical protein